jgi:formate dehydrogenase accessory protein FdhE
VYEDAMIQAQVTSPGLGDPWVRSIRRADQLAAGAESTAPLLVFYGRLLRHQKAIYDALCAGPPSGSLERDLPLLEQPVAALLRDLVAQGPAPLAAEARALLTNGSIAASLRSYCQARSDRQFVAKAVLQPYGQWLAQAGGTSRGHEPLAALCPRCGGASQLSILGGAGSPADDGGGRQLLCAACLTAWPFRRVLCPACGEEDEKKLGYFRTAAFEHVRIDACDTCRRYLKSIDLGQLGLAVPLVDEVAAAPLDLWAREHGYEKIALNLVGL